MAYGDIDETTRAAAARHVRGATIAWGGGRTFDFANPDARHMTIEDYAFALAYTVRWRGQARVWRRGLLDRLLDRPTRGRRAFYGVGQHVVIGTRHMMREGHDREDCLAFLMHESDEVPFGDIPGPVKPLMPDAVAVVKRAGAAVDRRFKVSCRDASLIKTFDIRMLVTERRDLLAGHESDQWHHATQGTDGRPMSVEVFDAFDERIIPYSHPDVAAWQFLRLHRELGGWR